MKAKRPILVFGTNCSFSGYGVMTERLTYQLAQRGWEISFYPSHVWEDYGPAYQWLKDRIVPDLGAVPGNVPALNFVTPFTVPIFSNWGGRKSCTFTMFETTRLSPDMMHNTCLTDFLIVPCNFCAVMYTACGYHKPVFICPLGYDPAVYTPKKERKDGPLRIGMSAMAFPSTQRKGVDQAVQAWLAVADQTESELWLHVTHAGAPYEHPRIKTMGMVTPEEQAKWYQDIDLLLQPSRGEGFGMIVLEAMACGTPAAAAIWSGTADVVNSEVGYPISFELEPAADSFYRTGYWANLSVEAMSEVILSAAADPHAVFRKGKKAAAAAKSFTWDRAGERLDTVLRKMFPE